MKPKDIMGATDDLSIVIIDWRVSDVFQVSMGYRVGSVVEILDPGCDGLDKMSEILIEHGAATELHLVGFGARDRFIFGARDVTPRFAIDNNQRLRGLGAMLDRRARVHLWTCRDGLDGGGVGEGFALDLGWRMGRFVEETVVPIELLLKVGFWGIHAQRALARHSATASLAAIAAT